MTFARLMWRRGWAAAMLAALLTPCAPFAAEQPDPTSAEPGDFQVVWVIIGEAASSDNSGAVRAGRQLFMAPDLMTRTLDNVKVERVLATPSIMEMTIGQQLCLSTLRIVASGPDKQQIDAAPLSVAIRQDHKQRLGLKRSKRNLCVAPNTVGEYPLRLTSLLPARDGTMRGAQIFVRVSDPKAMTANGDDRA